VAGTKTGLLRVETHFDFRQVVEVRFLLLAKKIAKSRDCQENDNQDDWDYAAPDVAFDLLLGLNVHRAPRAAARIGLK